MSDSRNYGKAVDLVRWIARQARVVAPDYVERMSAAAIAAHLNAKDEKIDRLHQALDLAEISGRHPDAC
jgi:hypothetical protein